MAPLEDDLQIDRFRNPKHRLSVNLLYTSNWLFERMQKVFKSFGLTNQQYNILRILRGSHPKPCTIQVLKSRMMDKQPDVSRLVDRLQKKGLVERTINDIDRRKMDVVITEEGLDQLSEMDPAVNAFEDWFEGLDEVDVDSLNVLLDKVRDQSPI